MFIVITFLLTAFVLIIKDLNQFYYGSVHCGNGYFYDLSRV